MSESTQHLVLWLIPCAPLISAAVTAFFGPKVMKSRSHWPCWLALLTSFICSLILLTVIIPGASTPDAHGHGHEAVSVVAPGFQWLKVGSFDVRIDLRADAMSAIMLSMVTGVSFLVALFASGYMHGDPGYARFFAAVSLFVFSMCMLVLAGSFLMLFAFWEAVGLCSYLLIGFWFRKPSAAAAAKKAFVVNRIGDFGFLIGIFLIWTTFGSMNFSDVLGDPQLLAAVAQVEPWKITLICLCLFVGAMGKSAQFPLHVWLPDAMEGPTPVSALIHAATMVTAGVYMVARCTPLFVLSPVAQMTVSGIGAATALLAALIALTQYDLKRVMAYSTVSQLGFMFMALGAGAGVPELATPAVTAAMFHLFTHAFFKALLFLSSGSVMHSMGDVIDMRRFSGLRHALPITHWAFLCGAGALAGFPLLAGFWSKDDILAVLTEASHHEAHGTYFFVILIVASFSALLTAFYTFRAYFMTFWGEEKFPEEAGHHPHDAPPIMAWPLRILSLFAVLIGLVVGPTHLFAGYLQQTPGLTHVESHGMHIGVMILSTIIAVVGIGAAWLMYLKSPNLSVQMKNSLRPLHELSLNKFYLDEIDYGILVWPLKMLAKLCTLFDRYVIDGLIAFVAMIPRAVSVVPRGLHNGVIPTYALCMFGGVIVCVVLMLNLLGS
ncbi:NADH-quinone oxidoreductase subunit L [Planctomicrobium sp. SH661]|uniref:NADH-quinone oxidoreductase subunit L n=1 Tax=Planctomicrobium sp. SH661 TaxID=3448124 RepID=UPI003F5B1547